MTVFNISQFFETVEDLDVQQLYLKAQAILNEPVFIKDAYDMPCPGYAYSKNFKQFEDELKIQHKANCYPWEEKKHES